LPAPQKKNTMKTKKEQTLTHWKSLPEGLPILPHMMPIPYGAKGSTYGACGIRIDGNPAFVDAVLSRLKDLMEGEGVGTRLGLSRSPVDGAGLGKSFGNRDNGAEVCYIRLHERGRQAAGFNAMAAAARARVAASEARA
jgi:hypothetical protein